ncbi:hypothetical protein [Salinicola avicenniae]|uniref:hypothetical protein n=1 Tax=Salinicola avicenniae TaxID=2916836 RepID=UPI00207403BF|nr:MULTISPECIES: hypothetical protein [unclassified Salinicola]
MLNSRIAAGAALVALSLTGVAQANDFECTQAGLKQYVMTQGQVIGGYMSQVENPRDAQADIASIMEKKEAEGTFDNHDDEMEKLVNDPNFEPSQKLCDDMQTSMDLIADYMQANPAQ